MTVHTVQLYRDESNMWRWRARSRNGRILAESGEGYVNYPHAQKMAEALFPDARRIRLERDG